MKAFTAEIQLHTLFVLNEQRRIVSTREQHPQPGPRFALIRDAEQSVWAARADVPEHVTQQLSELARAEPPVRDFRSEPLHANRYTSLLGGRLDCGPVFTFPESLTHAGDIVPVTDVAQLEQNFRGWTADEIPQCSPIMAVMEEGHGISVCFCARRTPLAAEAGVETAPPFRGRGLGGRVTAAWALAMREAGRLPLYSTSWSNAPSLGIARKLALNMVGVDWSLSD